MIMNEKIDNTSLDPREAKKKRNTSKSE